VRYVNHVEPGYDRDQVIGMPAESVIIPSSLAVFRASMESVLADGGVEEYDVEAAMTDGSTAWYRSRMTPFRRGGGIAGVVLVATNVTELKIAEESAAQLRRLLPICAWCEQIQDEDGVWETFESYLAKRDDTKVSHGLCPECFGRQMDGLDRSGTGSG
jgi:PAS domain S-box-containing protein